MYVGASIHTYVLYEQAYVRMYNSVYTCIPMYIHTHHSQSLLLGLPWLHVSVITMVMMRVMMIVDGLPSLPVG